MGARSGRKGNPIDPEAARKVAERRELQRAKIAARAAEIEARKEKNAHANAEKWANPEYREKILEAQAIGREFFHFMKRMEAEDGQA